jgi:Fur-regulated basic protein A
MGDKLRDAVERRRKFIIHSLLEHGIYKKEDKQLYELCLSELEREHSHIKGVGEFGYEKAIT